MDAVEPMQVRHCKEGRQRCVSELGEDECAEQGDGREFPSATRMAASRRAWV